MNLIKLFRNVRDRVQPKRGYLVQVRIWSEANKRYIGELTVSTDARTRSGAERNITGDLRMHVTAVMMGKKPVNGTKR